MQDLPVVPAGLGEFGHALVLAFSACAAATVFRYADHAELQGNESITWDRFVTFDSRESFLR